MIQRMFVTLDTKKTNYKNVGKINHGDDLILELTVLSDGDMISFNDPMVDLLVKKSDGKMIRQNSGIEHIKPNKFIIEVKKDCVTSPGLATNQLIINDNGRISTCMFYYTILNSLEEDIIQSISSVEVLEQLDEYVIEAHERMELLNDNIKELEELFGATSDKLVEAEMIRNEAEQNRAQSEILRVNNENDRIEADNIRNQNEVDRSSSELVREQRETERILNEEERRQNESERMIDESTRQQNENARQSNESIRMSNENDRKTQENRRVTAETNRVNAETIRRNNENSRISNESERQKTMNEMKSLIDEANGFDERIRVIKYEIEEINSSLDNKVSYPILDAETDVEDITQPYGSVLRYGAVGNGENDDSDAFQKAINNAYKLKVSVIVPSHKEYYIAKTLEVEYWRPLTIIGDGYGVNNANDSRYCNIYCTCDFLKRKNDGNTDKRARINLKYLNVCFYDNIVDRDTVTSHSVFNGVSLQNAHIENCYFYGLGYFIYNGNLNFVCKIERNQFMKINKAFICTYDRINKPTLSSIHYLSDSYITRNYINGNPETNPTFILGVSDIECDNVIENNYIDYFAYLFQCELTLSSGYYAVGKIVNNTLSSCFRITDNKIKGIFINNSFENWNRTMLDSKFTNQTDFMKTAKVGAFIIDTLDGLNVDFRWTSIKDNYINGMDYFIFIVNAPSTSTSFMRDFYEVGTRIMDATTPINDMFYYRPYNAGSRPTIFNTKIESLNYSSSSENAPTNLIQTYEYGGQTYSYFTGYKGQIKVFADGVFIAVQLSSSSYKWIKIGEIN